MTPSVRVLISVFFYGIANLILERKLSQYSVPSLMVLWEPIMFVCAVVLWMYYRYTDQPLIGPEFGWPFIILTIMAVAYFIADLSYVSAYTNGGNLFTITSVFLSFPLVAGAMKMVVDQQYPTRMQVLAYIFVSVGVLMFAWEESKKAVALH
jgi:drug/metabolite transporter (DMT)-like permease